MKNKIYLTCFPHPAIGEDDVLGQALSEDGKVLASHLSSSIWFSQHDMGLTSNWKHEKYKKYYPDGFDLEWVDNTSTHEGWTQALKLNQLRKEKHELERSNKDV